MVVVVHRQLGWAWAWATVIPLLWVCRFPRFGFLRLLLFISSLLPFFPLEEGCHITVQILLHSDFTFSLTHSLHSMYNLLFSSSSLFFPLSSSSSFSFLFSLFSLFLLLFFFLFCLFIYTFYLATILFLDVQKKKQSEFFDVARSPASLPPPSLPPSMSGLERSIPHTPGYVYVP